MTYQRLPQAGEAEAHAVCPGRGANPERLVLRPVSCVESPDKQKCFRCSGVRGDDAITRGMPRPSDTRAESDDESSDDDSDRDEMRRSIRESLVEARQILRPGGRKRGGKKHRKMVPSRPRLFKSAVRRACRRRAVQDASHPPAPVEAVAQPLNLPQLVRSIARRVANRVLHALNGNIAWRVMAAVALAPIVLRVEQGEVEMVGDVASALSVAVQDIVDESRIAVTRTIFVAGAFFSVVLLVVAAVALWFISRAMLNRLAHYVTGNPSQVSAELESYNGEAAYKVQGKLGVHKIFVQGGSGACGCKAFTNKAGFAGMWIPHS